MFRNKHALSRAEDIESRVKNLVDTVLDTIVDGVVTFNEDCEIQSYDKACVNLFGYTLEEVLGKNIYTLMLDPEHKEEEEEDKCPEHSPKNGLEKIIGRREVCGRRKDGSVFPMELAVGETGNGGHILVGVIRDISQRKAAEQTKGLLAAIVESSVDAIISKNIEGKIMSWNASAERLFGYTATEAIGRHISLIIPPDRLEEEEYILSELRAGRKMSHLETYRKMKNGSLLDVSLTLSPILDAKGKIIGASKILRDITERHEGEKTREQLRQAQKMEALGQLTGGIAHDFNNLLAVILGNLDFMVERTKEDDPLRTFLKPSIEAAEHGAELIKRLLAFGRKQALLPKIISMNELLNHFTDMVQQTLGKEIEVILTLDPGLWNVSVDPSQLQNALLNLAVNARDAMPQGGKLVFETKNTSLDEEYAENTTFEVVPGEYVLLTVSDTGEGMIQEVMDKAFEPFFTTKDVGKGSGLGLSMVYGFVKQSKGHIKLYSEPGHGTSIKIYLPRAEGAVLASVESVKENSVCRERKGKLIVIVEDNKNVLKLTSSMVESLGYQVLQAETSEAAIRMLELHPDTKLLLTDVMLPGAVNGSILAKRAVELYPNLKVLFNSGYTEQAILQSGILQAGVNLISKPFRKQQLANKIEEVLRQA